MEPLAVCAFCGQRCWTPGLPPCAPLEARLAYAGLPGMATCPEGQQFEYLTLGWCYTSVHLAMQSPVWTWDDPAIRRREVDETDETPSQARLRVLQRLWRWRRLRA